METVVIYISHADRAGVDFLIRKLAACICILGLQSISRDVAHNVSHPRRLDPTIELIQYFFVLYLQHGHHDVKCKPSFSLHITGREEFFS